jgi:O-antigen/teichoic acid export membrane protein
MTTRAPEPRRSRLRQLLSESTLYTLGNVARRSFSLITMPVFTRYLSTSGYGVLSIVGTVQNMLEVFYELGMGQSSTRFYYECQSARERQTLFGTLLILSLSVTAVLSVLLLAVGEWLWALVAPQVPFYPYIGLTIATVFFGGIGVLPRAIFRVENQVPRFFRLSVSQTALTAALAVVLVVGFAAGPGGPILATSVVTAIYAVVYAWALRGHVRWAFDWELARRALAFGLPEVPLRWGNWALKVSDRLILQRFTALSVVGLYSVGSTIGKTPFDLVANGIHWAIVPFFYSTATQESDERSRRIFAEVATWNVAILAALGLGTIVFASDLIAVLASSSFAAAGAVIPLIVAASFLESLFYIPSKGIYLKRKTQYLLPLFLVPAAINIGLNFALIPRFGMMGAAWSRLACDAIMVALTLVVSQRIYPIPYEYGRIGKIVLLAAVLAGAGTLVPDGPAVVRVAAKLVVMALFPVLLYAVGVRDDRLMSLVRGRLAARGFRPLGSRSGVK